MEWAWGGWDTQEVCGVTLVQFPHPWDAATQPGSQKVA